MKLVIRINPKTLKQESFRYLDPGPVPPIVDPEDPGDAKDGGLPEPEEVIRRKKGSPKKTRPS